jgi:hypothetical protein
VASLLLNGAEERGIAGYRNPEVVLRIAERACCSFEQGDTRFREMLAWLAHVARTGHQTAPSQRIDLAWHEFILFTKDYQAFCLNYFGRFIHHVPTPRVHRLAFAHEAQDCSSDTGGGNENDCTPSSNCSSGQTGGTGSDCKAEE